MQRNTTDFHIFIQLVSKRMQLKGVSFNSVEFGILSMCDLIFISCCCFMQWIIALTE